MWGSNNHYLPIGSMYAIYGNMDPINILYPLDVSINIPSPAGSVKWVSSMLCSPEFKAGSRFLKMDLWRFQTWTHGRFEVSSHES